MPYWLLTSTTYGTWLPGDPRGSVTSVRDVRVGEAPTSSRREHSVFGEAFEPENRGLRVSARERLAGGPIWLTQSQAMVVVRQFVETAAYREWKLVAAAVMGNHFHVVVGVQEEIDPRQLLTYLKSYATRGLNEQFGSPPSKRWWTRNGSRRKILNQAALDAAVNYVVNKQPNPLAIWPESPPSDLTNA